MKIGYIGLGALGGQLARRFVQSHELCVWDINAAAGEAFKALGAQVAPTATALAQHCDIIFLCLPRSADVHNVIFGQDGLATGLSPGKLIIDQTSGVPGDTRRMADELAKQGVAMMDAAVSASPHIVAAGNATLMVSGPDAIYDRALPALRAITETIYRCGTRVGDAQAMKMVNNAMNAGCRLGTLEVVAMGRKFGLSLAFMADFLNRDEARNQTTEKMLPALAQGKPSTNFALSLMLKDVNQAVALGMSLDIPMPMTTIVRSLLQIGANTLGSRAQLEDMVGLIESMAGTKLFDPAVSASDIADPDASISRQVNRAIASMCRLLSYECIAAGLQYGLALNDMAVVLNKGSGWSQSSKHIFSELLAGEPYDADAVSVDARNLQAACLLGNDLGAPMMMANAARSLYEQAVHQIGRAGSIDDIAGFVGAMSGIQLPPRLAMAASNGH
jgi:3-hydroxyisobutyrate dehydrogenase